MVRPNMSCAHIQVISLLRTLMAVVYNSRMVHKNSVPAFPTVTTLSSTTARASVASWDELVSKVVWVDRLRMQHL